MATALHGLHWNTSQHTTVMMKMCKEVRETCSALECQSLGLDNWLWVWNDSPQSEVMAPRDGIYAQELRN